MEVDLTLGSFHPNPQCNLATVSLCNQLELFTPSSPPHLRDICLAVRSRFTSILGKNAYKSCSDLAKKKHGDRFRTGVDKEAPGREPVLNAPIPKQCLT